jgi:hypothetical protein
MNKLTGKVGIAYDLPDGIDFDKKRPTSFDVVWGDNNYSLRASTKSTAKITEEVADIMRAV